jgi:hypothetical protein
MGAEGLASTPTSIVCPSCGKRYGYKPELAGKRVKCKCGGVIGVPAAPAPVEEEAAPVGFDDMDFGQAAHDAPAATPAPIAAAPRSSAKVAARPATAGAGAARGAEAPATAKDDWAWWRYAGAGVVIAGLTLFEFNRLGQLESGEVESMWVGRYEALAYKLVGRTGVLVIGLLLAAALLAFGVRRLMQARAERA